jgi:hypothetical protein
MSAGCAGRIHVSLGPGRPCRDDEFCDVYVAYNLMGMVRHPNKISKEFISISATNGHVLPSASNGAVLCRPSPDPLAWQILHTSNPNSSGSIGDARGYGDLNQEIGRV